jgi:hypothetical protein
MLEASAGDTPPQDDGRDRGLLFVAYQADLGRQFEVVQRWLNDRNLPVAGAGQDPIAGQGENPARLRLRSSGSSATEFDMLHYVSMTGGGYFFTPSLTAVRFLADPTTPWEHQEAIMGDLSQQQLGELIANQNPYGPMTFIDFDSVVKSGLGKGNDANLPYKVPVFEPTQNEYWQGFFWTVGATAGQTETIRVSKAMRIRYKVGDAEYRLVVGYEGAGGM